MQILAKLFVRVFQIRHEDVSCFQQGVEGLVSLPRKSDFCRLLCDKSSGQLLYHYLSFVPTSMCQSILWSKPATPV